MKKIISLHFALFILLLPLFSCNTTVSNEDRTKHLSRSKEDLLIGIVDSFPDSTQFVQGIKIAINEINNEGGVLGRQINPLIFYDYNHEKTSLRIAKKIASNKNVMAVIGHFDPKNAMPASILYKATGILLFSTGADLLRFGGAYIFNNYMPDNVYVEKIAECLAQEKYSRVIILNDRQKNNKVLADFFYEQAVEKGLSIVFQKSFSHTETNFRDILSDFKSETFDIVLLLCGDQSAALVVNQMREMNITVPIIATDEIDTRYFWSNTGKKAEGTIIPTNFDQTYPRKLTQDFVSNFTQTYGVEPDTFAARGYDLVHLLKTAIEKSNSYLPMVLDTTLRFMDRWEGVLSQYCLTRNGNISPSVLFFKKYDDGKYVILNRKEEKKEDSFDLIKEITLRLAINNELFRLDPGLANDNLSIEFSKQLFLRLTQYQPGTYLPTPDFAMSWEPNDALTQYRFKLRKNTFWTNGQPVTAHDLKFAILRNLHPDTQCPNVEHLFILKNARDIHQGVIKDSSELGVKIIDDYTIDFFLSYPAAFFPSLTGLPVYSPQPSDIIKQFGNNWTDPGHMVSNGPYALANYEEGSLLILRKNDRYYDANNVSIQEIRYNIILNNLLALNMYQNNQLDIIGGPFSPIPTRLLDSVKQHPETRYHYNKITNFSTTALFFNSSHTPVDNIMFRKAIASVMDRLFLTRFVIQGKQKAMHTFIPSDLLLASSPATVLVYNPNHAKQMLAEAGYPEGKGCPLLLIESGNQDNHKKIAKAISLLLEKKLHILSKVITKNSVRPGQSHIIISDWHATFPEANSFLLNQYEQFSRHTNYINTELSDLMNQTIKEKDSHIRKQNYFRMDDMLVQKETLVVPIYYESDHYLIRPRLKGWYHMPLGGQNIKDWQLN